MKRNHDKRRARRVAQPVQVYLDTSDRGRLDRLVALLDTTKSDVLRRGLDALEQQVTDPEAHPALRMIGMVTEELSPAPYDVAREHDRFLAESEIESWGSSSKKGRGR